MQTLGILKETKLKYFETLWKAFQEHAGTMRGEEEWSLLIQSALYKYDKSFSTNIWPQVWSGEIMGNNNDLKIFHLRRTLNIGEPCRDKVDDGS